MKKLATTLLFIFLGFLLNADVHLDPLTDCCTQINQALYLVKNNTYELVKLQKEVITAIEGIDINPIVEIVNPPDEQMCDFCSIIGAIIGALLSGGVAIFVFWRGKKIDDKKIRKGLRSQGEGIFSLLKNIVKNLKVQIDELKELITTIKNNPYEPLAYKKISLAKLLRAKTFNTNTIFSIFRELGLSEKDFNAYYSHLDFLYEILNAIASDCESKNTSVVIALSNKFIKEREAILDKMVNYYEQCRLSDKKDDKLSVFLNELTVKYYEGAEPVPNLAYDVDNLLRPLKDGLMKDFRGEGELVDKLLDMARGAVNQAASIRISNDEIAKDVNSQLTHIESSTKGIEDLNDKFSRIFDS